MLSWICLLFREDQLSTSLTQCCEKVQVHSGRLNVLRSENTPFLLTKRSKYTLLQLHLLVFTHGDSNLYHFLIITVSLTTTCIINLFDLFRMYKTFTFSIQLREICQATIFKYEW